MKRRENGDLTAGERVEDGGSLGEWVSESGLIGLIMCVIRLIMVIIGLA